MTTKSVRSHLTAALLAAGFLAVIGVTTVGAADPSAADKSFLTAYTQAGNALAADDLTGAKRAAAGGLAGEPDGSALANAADLAAARDAFGRLSVKAGTLAKGQPGYHVFNCPMAKKDWVQTSPKLANPYYGKEMLTCGVEKK